MHTLPHLVWILCTQVEKELGRTRVRGLNLSKKWKLVIQTIFYLQMTGGVKLIWNRMGMWAIENTLSNTVLYLKSSAAPADHRFTILSFTSGLGEAICCVVIFQHKEEEVPMTWKTGINITVENPIWNEKGEIYLELNIGDSKYYPEGPKCNYRGKEVECLTFASESGGITGEILVKILEYFDQLQLFERHLGGPIPMLIVDGHQSRLD